MSRPRNVEAYDRNLERIVDISAELFARNGYHSTGVAELGAAVGLARGALYYYIGSKSALLARIHDRVMDPLLDRSRRIAELDERAAVRLVLLSDVLLRLIVQRRDHVWVFLHEHRQLEGDDMTTFRAKRAEYESIIAGLLTEGVTEGSFHVDDLRLTTLMWLNIHNYTYHWIRRESDVAIEQLRNAYCKLFLQGVGPDLDVDAIIREADVVALTENAVVSYADPVSQ